MVISVRIAGGNLRRRLKRMKANYLDNSKKKRILKDFLNKEQQKTCEKCLERINRECVETSKYNALFHTFHMLEVLHDEFGFGKKRLERLLGAYHDRDASFKEDLADGVAWTKMRKRFEKIGLEFSEEDIELCNQKERLYEKNITYAEKKKRRR